MRQQPSEGPQDTGVDAWEALHQGLDAAQVDSPSTYVLNKSAVMLPIRLPGTSKPGQARAMAPVAAEQPERSTTTNNTARQRTMTRPYARTRGRTRPDYELALEAMVSTSDRGRRYEGAVTVQHRRICDLCCVATRSIAEIAAYLVLPLNVVKVLVSDMDNLGLVMIHQPALTFGDRSSREFMARVLKGLRSL